MIHPYTTKNTSLFILEDTLTIFEEKGKTVMTLQNKTANRGGEN